MVHTLQKLDFDILSQRKYQIEVPHQQHFFKLYGKYLYKGLETKQKQTIAIFNIVESYDNLIAIHLD